METHAQPATPAAEPHARARELIGFIERLTNGYEALRAAGGDAPEPGDDFDNPLTSLALAEAAVRFWDSRAIAGRPPQIAVMGPTQTGKSTLVNLLLGAAAAETSPLAGFTVHPQGFWRRGPGDTERWTDTIFPGWLRSPPDALDRERLDSYSLSDAPPGDAAIDTSVVVWDTPDFDTLLSRTYRRGLIEVAALADVIVLALSKEKYADLTVWRMVELLRPLGRPMLFCLNKLPEEGADAIADSLRGRIERAGIAITPTTISRLPFVSRLGAKSALVIHGPAEALRGAVRAALPRARASDAALGVRALISANWDRWLAPIRAELAAQSAWKKSVAAACESFLAEYRRDYLDHPHRFDSLKRATVELLHLLELPGIAATLSKVRAVVTWPARLVFARGRAWLGTGRPMAGGPAGEELVAFGAIDRLLTRLARDAGRRADAGGHAARVWSALAATLTAEEERMRAEFRAAVSAHRDAFESEIRAAADRLYAALRERPTVLNTLRMARVTTDAAGVALVIKTGGLGMNDLLFGPLMFGVTTLLTEGALGAYMTRVAEELRRRQYAQFRSAVVDAAITRALLGAATELEGPGLFGVSPSALAAAERHRADWGAQP